MKLEKIENNTKRKTRPVTNIKGEQKKTAKPNWVECRLDNKHVTITLAIKTTFFKYLKIFKFEFKTVLTISAL